MSAPPGEGKAVSHLDVLLSRHQAAGRTWALGGNKQNNQRNIQIVGWIFHMGHLCDTWLGNRGIHFHFPHS